MYIYIYTMCIYIYIYKLSQYTGIIWYMYINIYIYIYIHVYNIHKFWHILVTLVIVYRCCSIIYIFIIHQFPPYIPTISSFDHHLPHYISLILPPEAHETSPSTVPIKGLYTHYFPPRSSSFPHNIKFPWCFQHATETKK